MSQIAVPPADVLVEQKQFRLDLACGQVCAAGFEGVDIAPGDGVKHVVDLMTTPWPFETSSVDEARSSHFFEHLDGDQQIGFMNELWRILKPGAGALITTPFGWSVRAWQDPTHKRPIFVETYLYYQKAWREANKLTHGPYAKILCDFDITTPHQAIDGFLQNKNLETQQWLARHCVNTVHDIVVLAVAKK